MTYGAIGDLSEQLYQTDIIDHVVKMLGDNNIIIRKVALEVTAELVEYGT